MAMKKIQHILPLLAAILVMLCFSQPLLAEEKPIGLVVALRGNVIAINAASGQRNLTVRSDIYRADTIKTNDRGRVQMMFDDHTLVSLGPNSDMQIADYQWDPEKKTGEMKTQIDEGVFRIMGGAITQSSPDKFKTETPAGTIGIRGSMYAGKVDGSSLHLLFLGGKGVYLSNDAGTVNIDRPGFGTFAAGPSSAPTKPDRMTGEEMTELNDIEPDISTAPGEEDDGDQDAESQSSPDATNEPVSGDSDAEQTTQDQTVQETVNETFADGEIALSSETDTISAFQTTVKPNPVDAVKDIANQAVIDSIETDRQDEVLEIEKAILDLLLELGFVGNRATMVPASGIEGFDGVVRHKLNDSQEYSEDPSKMVVNWHNKKFFGVVDDPNQTDERFPVFFFGDVNGTALENVQVIGSDYDSSEHRVSSINGTGTFGQLYGDDAEAVGFAVEGVDVNVQFQSDQQGWTAYGAEIHSTLSQTTAPTGTDIFNGFVVGYAEDMAAPNVNRRIFTNNQPADFQLNINRDTGIISGRLTATDINGSSSAINNLEIGGSLPSAYIVDDAMIALLGGADSISTAGSSGGLKEYGNYLVTRKEETPMAAYTTWGYWEMAYRDPDSGADYHLHGPGSYWIAGPQTPASEVSNLMATNFSGVYSGGAQGFLSNTTGQISELTGGATNLTIDFSPSATFPVSGTISFDQINLNLMSSTGDVTTDGFGAQISGATTSSVQGAFFGPNAAAVGGKFGARMSGGEGYYGIFAGSR
jgi:hypothetical protein